MSKAKRKARALASPLELQRKESRKGAKSGSKQLIPETLTATEARTRKENQYGANVPARVIERMGGTTRNARTSLNDSGPKMRPKRKAHTVGREAAGTFAGRDYGSKGDGIKRVSDARIRANRDAYFASTAANRKAAKVARTAESTAPDPVTAARKAYEHAIGESRARAAVGDASGAEAWMREAREHRRIFRNK